jgi:hypothetical protein
VQAANYAGEYLAQGLEDLGLFKMIFSGDPRKWHPRSERKLADPKTIVEPV